MIIIQQLSPLAKENFVKNIIILSSPADQSIVEDGNNVARATHS